MAFFRRPELEGQSLDALYLIWRWARRIDKDKDGALDEEEWGQLQKDQLNYIREHSVIAVQLEGKSASAQPEIIWNENEYVAEVPSLVKAGDNIYMVMNGGCVLCMDSKTGNIIFRERLGASGAYLASPLYANGNIYFASYNGKITVIKPGHALNIVVQSNLYEKIGASPMALDNMLYIRTDKGLYAYEN